MPLLYAMPAETFPYAHFAGQNGITALPRPTPGGLSVESRVPSFPTPPPFGLERGHLPSSPTFSCCNNIPEGAGKRGRRGWVGERERTQGKLRPKRSEGAGDLLPAPRHPLPRKTQTGFGMRRLEESPGSRVVFV